MNELIYLRNLFTLLAAHFSEKYSAEITYEDIFAAIFIRFGDKFDMEHPVHVWSMQIDYQTAVDELDNFDFKALRHFISFDSPIIPFEIRFQTKALFKAAGEVWVIHKYDADPFPSKPHAHNVENNLKLDLSNGNLYRNRKYKGSIRLKDLMAVRDQALKVFDGDLPALAI